MQPFNPSPVGTPSSPENKEINYENFDRLKEVTGGRIDIGSFLKGYSTLSENENKYLGTLTDPSDENQEYIFLESNAKERDALYLAKMLTEKDHWYVDSWYEEGPSTGEKLFVSGDVRRPLTNKELEERDYRSLTPGIRVDDDPEKFKQEREFINKSFDDLVEYFVTLPRERRDANFAMRTLLEALTDIYLGRVPSNKLIAYEENEDINKLKRLVVAVYPEEIMNPRGAKEKKLEAFIENYFVMKKEDQERVDQVIAVVDKLSEIQKRYLLKQVFPGLDTSELIFTEDHKFD